MFSFLIRKHISSPTVNEVITVVVIKRNIGTVIKKSMPILSGRMQWGVFNLFFICLYQMGLIFLFTLPILSAWQGSDTSLYWADYLIAGLMLLLIVLETISDQQQYDFQNKKYKKMELGKSLEGDYKRGFITSGLWAFSRHPNYYGEIMFWWGIFVFGSSFTGLNYLLLAPIAMTAMFWYASIPWIEIKILRTRPQYKDYQKRVHILFPEITILRRLFKG